ncbi:Scr1 family TA system antitoxin-like transcriptional regulator [Embleya sp. NPDC127516]|uniref:helix-turn-helix domain-containing protein n=1 Tax=Embleya sp. NPDC127516 TaxID=3363990 RepID=UPI00381E2350
MQKHETAKWADQGGYRVFGDHLGGVVKRLIEPGNPAFVAARHQRGWHSQQRLADAFEQKAVECGFRIGVSVRQVRRWESAEPPWPSSDYQTVLEALFGLPLTMLGFSPPVGSRRFEEEIASAQVVDIVEGLHEGEQSGWWRTDPNEGSAARVDRLVQVEQRAVVTRTYESSLIPGPLQVYEYAVAAIRAFVPALPEDQVIRRARRRTERLADLTARSDGSRALLYIIDEPVLHRSVGSEAILRDQLAHLLVTVSALPHVELRVMPLSAGGHPGMAGPFVLFDLGDRRVVYTEALTGASWTSRPACLAAYAFAYDRLQAAALTADESMHLVAQRLAELETAWMLAGDGRPAATAEEKTVSRSRFWERSSE